MFWGGKVWGQTYTTSGLSTDWNDPAAWVKTNPNGNPNFGLTSNTPPLGSALNYPYSSPVNIIINHQINYSGGNTSIGGGNYGSLIVNSGGSISFNGELNVNNSGGNFFNFQVNDGASFVVGGTLGIRSGATFNVINSSNLDPKSLVQVNNLTFLNAGSGQSVNVGSNTIFNVINLTRMEGGGVLNIQGEFNTNTFNSANSGGTQVNVSGDGLLRTTGNMQIDGYPMNLSGNAGVVVGGNLNITNSGNSSLNLNGPNTNFTVISSGSTIASGKTPSGSCFQTPENGNNCINPGCLEIVTITSTGNQYERVYIFKCSSTWIVPSDSVSAGSDSLDIIDSFRSLTVAGGGGGGRGTSSGGGGAGGLIYISDETFPPGTSLNIIVGKGGLGSTNINNRGQNGGNSSIQGKAVAIGGGGGGSSANSSNAANRSGNPGGSGGGSGNAANNENINGGLSTSSNPPTITTPNNSTIFGNNGGASSANGSNRRGGGGGGAGSTGGDGTRSGSNNIGGNGGIGRSYDISGSLSFYAGGGGGNSDNIKGLGGSSIGGSADGTGSLKNGTPNTGSGGGAGSSAGGNGGSGIVIIRSIILRILPVEFLSINATYQTQTRTALLDWSTAKEWENSHFEIERAVNSVKDWETIGRVEGSGYSEAPVEYSFTDTELPKTGGNIFYRLKQVDFSGKFSYSRTRAIQVDPIDSKSVWVAYPNPSNIGSEISVALLRFNDYHDELISLRLINMLGESQSTLLYSPDNISEVVSGWLLTKKAGIYILDIRWGTNSQQIKLLRK